MESKRRSHADVKNTIDREKAGIILESTNILGISQVKYKISFKNRSSKKLARQSYTVGEKILLCDLIL